MCKTFSESHPFKTIEGLWEQSIHIEDTGKEPLTSEELSGKKITLKAILKDAVNSIMHNLHKSEETALCWFYKQCRINLQKIYNQLLN